MLWMRGLAVEHCCSQRSSHSSPAEWTSNEQPVGPPAQAEPGFDVRLTGSGIIWHIDLDDNKNIYIWSYIYIYVYLYIMCILVSPCIITCLHGIMLHCYIMLHYYILYHMQSMFESQGWSMANQSSWLTCWIPQTGFVPAFQKMSKKYFLKSPDWSSIILSPWLRELLHPDLKDTTIFWRIWRIRNDFLS